MAKQKPKDKGTKAETGVVNWAKTHDMWKADRIILHGVKDHGDVKLTDRVMVQVKDGYTEGRPPTDYLIGKWLEAVETQRKAGGFEYAMLVHKRAGRASPDGWRWYIDGHTYLRLTTRCSCDHKHAPPYVELQGYMIPNLMRQAGLY